jgi:hypothetical protein
VLSHRDGIGSFQRLPKKTRAMRLPLCKSHGHHSGQDISANAEIDFVSFLDQYRKRQYVMRRACGHDILATN